MKISDLIEKLKELKSEYGDLQVEVVDTTCGDGEFEFAKDVEATMFEDEDTNVRTIVISDRETVIAFV